MSSRMVIACLAAGLLGACARGLEAAPVQVVDTSQVLMAKSYQFDPVAIRVPVGATVTWINNDNFTHDVRLQAMPALRLQLHAGASRGGATALQSADAHVEPGAAPAQTASRGTQANAQLWLILVLFRT